METNSIFIQKNYQNANNFDFSKTIGSFINNREFSNGNREYQISGDVNRRTFIWDSLQNIGNDIGEIAYANILNYIDNVSNVESCKTKSLDSMIKEVGLNFDLSKILDRCPLEIGDMIDVYSIEHKFFNDNRFLSYDTIDEIQRATYEAISSDEQIRTELSATFKNGQYESYNIQTKIIDDEKYYEFLKNQYENVLCSMILLKYNVDSPSAYIYPDAEKYIEDNGYRFKDDEIYQYKIKNNIEMSFNPSEIVDNIDNGLDDISNYSGAKLNLINREISKRSEKLTVDKLNSLGVQLSSGNFNQTRYSYYRKAKVVEYAKFINDIYFINNNYLSNRIYDLDSKYILLNQDKEYQNIQSVISVGNSNSIIPEQDINYPMIETVAKYLATTTINICEIRKKLKNQIRKYYIKGTNSLILYLINQYMIDYSKIYSKTNDLNGQEYVGGVIWKMNDHTSKDIDVVEYYDKTEYYNINTDKSVSSLYGDFDTNDRFWENGVMNQDPPDAFKLNQIDKFYLSTMLNDKSFNHDDLTDFLDVVYSTGATQSFIDKKGMFSTKLADGTFTSEIYDKLSTMIDNRDKLSAMMSEDYQYVKSMISDQISTILYSDIMPIISNEYFVGISDVYNQFNPKIKDLSSQFDDVNIRYGELLSGNYGFYFKDNSQSKDYFIGNPRYQTSSLVENIFNLVRYSSIPENISNAQLSDATRDLIETSESVSSDIYSNVLPVLSTVGYDMSAEYNTTNDLLTKVEIFTDSTIEKRKQYLENSIEGFKTQVNDLKKSLDNLNNTFITGVSNYDTKSKYYTLGTNEYYFFTKGGVDTSSLKIISQKQYKAASSLAAIPQARAAGFMIQEPGTGIYFYEQPDSGWTGYKVEIPKKNVFNPSSNLMDRCSQLIYWLNLKTFDDVRGLHDDGTEAMVLAVKNGLKSIDDSYQNILEQINGLFGYDFSKEFNYSSIKTYVNSKAVEDRIFELLEFINTKLDESIISNEKKLVSYKDLRSNISILRNKYDIISNEMTRIRNLTDQRSYLTGFKYDINVYTIYNLGHLQEYILEKDKTSYDEINKTVNNLLEDTQKLRDDYSQTSRDINGYEKYEEKDTYYMDMCIKDISEFTESIVEKNLENAQVSVEYIMENQPIKYVSYLSSNIDCNTDRDFFEVVNEKIDELDFFDEYVYNNDYRIFLTYSGLSTAYYPYYNLKNTTHSSYQIHPFLWKFVEKNQSNINSLLKQYYSQNINDMILSKVANTIDDYYGKYGELINKWKHPDSKDYTGYSSNYEDGYKDAYDNGNQVIDYEGMFFPDTIQYLNATENLCNDINSVRYGKDVKTIVNDIDKTTDVFSTDIIKWIEYDLESYEVLNCDKFIQEISSCVIPYVQIDEKQLSGIAKSYFDKTNPSDWSANGIRKTLLDNIPQTFFGMYYSHLGYGVSYDLYKERCQYIANQLSSYYNSSEITSIKDITDNHALSDIYDIYSFGTDSNGNSYAIYKKYDSPDPSFKEKQNTLGQLWIRFKNNPLAFPAFSGDYPQVDISSMNSGLKKLVGISETTQHVSCDCNLFYDMKFSDDMTQMVLISKNGSDGISAQIYENPWIIYTPNKNFIDDKNVLKISLKQIDGSQQDYIESGYGPNETSHLSDITESQVSNMAFIGTFTNKQDDINCLFVEKTYALSGNTIVENQKPKLYVVRDCVIEKSPLFSDDVRFENQAKDDIVLGKYNDNTNGKTILGIAYLTRNALDTMGNVLFETKVNIDRNTNGPDYTDPTTDEMNSHDIFEQNVKVMKFQVDSDNIVLNETNEFNQNADMSYIPHYPGISGELDMNNTKLSSQEYYNIELLGVSKDIEKQIGMVNTETNPYFDEEIIRKNDTFGMVYEEFNHDDEYKSFFKHENKALNNSKEKYIKTIDGRNCYFEEIDLANKFTSEQFLDSRIIMLNKKTIGKNPYVFDNLSSFYDDKWYSVSYDNQLSGQDSEIIVKYDGNQTGSEITLIGLYDQINKYNSFDSNHISGISDIKICINSIDRKLSVAYVIDQKSTSYDHIFIPKGQIQTVIVNEHMLDQFEEYHYFDTYGLINYGLIKKNDNYKENIISDGWCFIYDKSQGHTIEISSDPYYVLSDGTQIELSSIHLSDYTNLSDVYVLYGNDRLSFKYQEENYFRYANDMYYYQTLNTNYPKTLGQVAVEKGKISKINVYDIVKDTFNDTNMFILNIEDPNDIISSIGVVDIPIKYTDSDNIRVYEDYFSNDISRKFDPDDIRTLEYVKYDEGISSYEKVSSDYDNSTEFYNSLLDLNVRKQEKYQTDISFDKIRFEVGLSSIENLDNLTKIFVNYRKNSNGEIELYFNYYNYLNTPFIKMEDNKIYPDIIPSTYLHIKPGENGMLDTVVQFKYKINGTVYGYKNATIASYRIFNVSDDKPKFVIQRAGIIKRNTLIEKDDPYVELKCSQLSVDISNQDSYNVIIDAYLQIISNVKLKPGYNVYIQYDSDRMLLEQKTGYYSDRYDIDSSIKGLLKVTVKYDGTLSIPYEVKMTSEQLFKNIGSEMFMIMTYDDIKTEDYITVNPKIVHGKLTVYRSNRPILVFTTQDTNNGNDLSAYVTNNHYIDPIS